MEFDHYFPFVSCVVLTAVQFVGAMMAALKQRSKIFFRRNRTFPLMSRKNPHYQGDKV